MSTALIKHTNTVAKTCHRLAVEEDYQISCLYTDAPRRFSFHLHRRDGSHRQGGHIWVHRIRCQEGCVLFIEHFPFACSIFCVSLLCLLHQHAALLHMINSKGFGVTVCFRFLRKKPLWQLCGEREKRKKTNSAVWWVALGYHQAYITTELQARSPTLESRGTVARLHMLAAAEGVEALYCSFLTRCGVFETQFAFRILQALKGAFPLRGWVQCVNSIQKG